MNNNEYTLASLALLLRHAQREFEKTAQPYWKNQADIKAKALDKFLDENYKDQSHKQAELFS